MGDRGNIELTYKSGSQIYFYTHWTGSILNETLARALNRGKGRWNDESYLARIIFSEMIKDDVLDDVGYGIAPYQTDVGEFVEVNLDEQTADGKPYQKFIDYHLTEQAV